MSELETRYVFLVLFGLGGLATFANSQAVLPAYLVGVVLARVFMANPSLIRRTRSIAFTFLTPFFFLKAGLLASLPMMAGAAGIIILLLVVKLGAKFVGLYPLTKALGYGRREGMYTTFLMSAGLTLDVIMAMYGVSHGIIDQTKYTVLVTATILSAVVPTLIAQLFFRPKIATSSLTEMDTAQDMGETIAAVKAARTTR